LFRDWHLTFRDVVNVRSLRTHGLLPYTALIQQGVMSLANLTGDLGRGLQQHRTSALYDFVVCVCVCVCVARQLCSLCSLSLSPPPSLSLSLSLSLCLCVCGTSALHAFVVCVCVCVSPCMPRRFAHTRFARWWCVCVCVCVYVWHQIRYEVCVCMCVCPCLNQSLNPNAYLNSWIGRVPVYCRVF
jgi:hypothetical protein